jgi:hypothetical protein
MRAIVPHTRRLMMVKTAHKWSDFAWNYKGWKILKKNTVGKAIKIGFSQHPLDETQFRKRKPIREVLVSRIVAACIVIQWVCSCMIPMVKSHFLAMFFVLCTVRNNAKKLNNSQRSGRLYLPLCIQN